MNATTPCNIFLLQPSLKWMVASRGIQLSKDPAHMPTAKAGCRSSSWFANHRWRWRPARCSWPPLPSSTSHLVTNCILAAPSLLGLHQQPPQIMGPTAVVIKSEVSFADLLGSNPVVPRQRIGTDMWRYLPLLAGWNACDWLPVKILSDGCCIVMTSMNAPSHTIHRQKRLRSLHLNGQIFGFARPFTGCGPPPAPLRVTLSSYAHISTFHRQLRRKVITAVREVMVYQAL
jgi:hypothetical protein